ncbi:hypothetical protein CTA2_10944, partial [Colletotrichum tanaceti]
MHTLRQRKPGPDRRHLFGESTYMPPRSFGLRTTTNCSFFLSLLSFFVLVGCLAWDDSLERDWSEDDDDDDAPPAQLADLVPEAVDLGDRGVVRRAEAVELGVDEAQLRRQRRVLLAQLRRLPGLGLHRRGPADEVVPLRHEGAELDGLGLQLFVAVLQLGDALAQLLHDGRFGGDRCGLGLFGGGGAGVVVDGCRCYLRFRRFGLGDHGLDADHVIVLDIILGGRRCFVDDGDRSSYLFLCRRGCRRRRRRLLGGRRRRWRGFVFALDGVRVALVRGTHNGGGDGSGDGSGDGAHEGLGASELAGDGLVLVPERRVLRPEAVALLGQGEDPRALVVLVPEEGADLGLERGILVPEALGARLEPVVLGPDGLERPDLRLEPALAELELALGGLEALEPRLHVRVGGLELRQADLDLVLLDLEGAEADLHLLLLGLEGADAALDVVLVPLELLHVGLEALLLRLERVVAVPGGLPLRLEPLDVGLELPLALVEVVDAGLQAPVGLGQRAVLLVELVDLGLVRVDVGPQEVALGRDVAHLGAPADELRLEPGDADLEALPGQLQRGDALDEGALRLLGDVVGVADAPLQVAAPRLKVLPDPLPLGRVHLQDGVPVGGLVLGAPLEGHLLLEVVGPGLQPLPDAPELVPLAGDVSELLLVLAEAALDVVQEPALLVKVAGDLVLEAPLLAALLLRLVPVGGERREPLQGVLEPLVGIGLLAEQALGLLLHARDLLEEPILHLFPFAEL